MVAPPSLKSASHFDAPREPVWRGWTRPEIGGAMTMQIRVGAPLFSHILFIIYLGLFTWGGL